MLPTLTTRRLTVLAALLLQAGWAWSQALPVASPESVGVSSKRLEKISQAMQAEVEQKRLPGAVVMVARKGKLVYSQAFGKLNNGSDAPMQIDSVFRIYSMTKPLVSTALMMLVEDGKVQLTDPVSKYLPTFKSPMVSVATHDPLYNGVSFKLVPANKEPTIQDLLRHTSGLAYGELTKNTLVKDATRNQVFTNPASTLMPARPVAPRWWTAWAKRRWHNSLAPFGNTACRWMFKDG
jgi:CubicO group peptidase (beta-lactamase class C family)